jgi:hypothetical protein
MAEHAHVCACVIEPGRSRRGYLAVFKQYMTEGDLEAAPPENKSSGEPAGFKVIHVAGHGGNRREPPQALNHVCAADVAGMEDLPYPRKMPLDGRIIQPMRIGDHPDPRYRASDQCAA